MDCNREEAIRAKETAEQKMQNNDFVAAKKIAEKAQKLYPGLENITQLLIVCEVHCSARNKIAGTEMDWYGILQVAKGADEGMIKKQYRKLALVLHPDKNKLPGAEAAFKMIGEANNVLSDKGKRSLYDMKCRGPVRPAVTMRAPHQANRNSFVPKHYTPVQPSSTSAQPPFWTTCPFCNVRYQYLREFVNRALRCQTCSKPFIAYDLGAQGVTSESDKAPGSFKVGSQSSVFPPPHMGPQRNFSNNTASSDSAAKHFGSAGFGGGFTSKAHEERVRSAKFEAVKPGERRSSKKRNRKRGRKSVVESSESSDASSSSESEEETFTAGNGSFDPLNGDQPRRSFRKRQQVKYDENVSDDDNLPRSMKRLRKASSTNGKEAFDDQKPKTPVSTSSHDEEDEVKETHLDGEEDPSAKPADLDDSDSDKDPEPALYNLPDPEFSDFDKAKEDKCFAVDQIWACYDSADGMPRFYARVRKTYPYQSGFRLRITWLEPNPEGSREVCWFNEGLPVACGNFVLGESEETTNRDTFSHQISFEKGSRRCSYVIYPRKGEIWAMFKDWDISWSSNSENHKEYKYEIVEVVSDSVEGGGIKVTHLDKVEGFVSVFQRTSRDGLVSCSVPSAELLRFSHRIPAFQLSGKERDGVPPGSFELDTASLSSDFYPDVGGNSSNPAKTEEVVGEGKS